MTTSNDNQDVTNRLPDKLAKRVDEFQNLAADDESIVANGDIELTSKHPVAVVEYFLSTHRSQWSEATFSDYSYDLTRLLEYFDYADIDDISTISSRDIEGFRQWRQRDGNILLATLHGQLSNIRVFIKWCERVEIVEEGVAAEMRLPNLEPSDIVSHTRIDANAAKKIREYYDKLPYVPVEYAMFCVMWSVLLRLGGLRALDVEDYHRDEGYIEINHRPEEDTPLKNGSSGVEGEGGEREVNLPNWVCEVLNIYIDGTGDPNHPKRKETMDDYGRNPLFTTRAGRISKSTIRRKLYKITQPCRYGDSCPEGLNPTNCAARNDNRKLSRCPSNVSPHPVRRGGICHQLNQGVSKQTICERADVSRPVLNKHYDLRTKQEARKQRRKELQETLDDEFEHRNDTRCNNNESIKDKLIYSTALNVTPSAGISEYAGKRRIIKGTVGFAGYLLLIGINIWLMASNGVDSLLLLFF